MYKNEYFRGTGRRKTSVARVYMKVGDGVFMINDIDAKKYLHVDSLYHMAYSPITAVSLQHINFDIFVNVEGGGVMGQADAIKMGIARAIVEYEKKEMPQAEQVDSLLILGALDSETGEENAKVYVSLKRKLRKIGYLTRDSRKVQRKMYGKKKARKSEQYSKR